MTKRSVFSALRVRLAAYFAMVGGAVAVYLWVRARGERLSAWLPAVGSAEGVGGEFASTLGSVLLALAVVTVLARVLGFVFRRFLRQPAVMGEIVAGIVLGPSVLGALRPEAQEFVLPSEGGLSQPVLGVVFAGLLLSAVATEAIGVHALFGAFLFGALLPSVGRLARELHARLESVVLVLLLPSFFALTGLRTRIGLLEGAGDWLVCALIVAVATVGKLGGTLLAARLTGMGWRAAVALGLLMNTRGLMELIVLNLGLELGVITPKVFTMLVLMALVTTFMTCPALELLLGRRGFERVAEMGVERGSS